MNTKEDEMLISEKTFKTFVNQSIDNSINKSREEIFAVIESKDFALKKEIERQGNMVEEQIKNLKNTESHHTEILNKMQKEFYEMKEKQMTKIFEQMNSLMVRVGCLEDKLMKSERNRIDVSEKLSHLESADLFLQESNRMLTEKVSSLNELLQKQEMTKYNQRIVNLEEHMQQAIEKEITLSKDIHEEKNKLNEIIKQWKMVENDLKTLKEGNDKNYKKNPEDLKEQIYKQSLEIAKMKDLIRNINELKQNKIEIMEYKEEVRALMMKNDDAISLLDRKLKQSLQDILNNKKALIDIKNLREEDQQVLLSKVLEQQQSLDKLFNTIEEKDKALEKMQRDQISSTQFLQSNMEESTSGRNIDKHLADRVQALEVQKVEEMKRNRNCMGFGKTNFWALILEIYAAFRGYTLVVRSEGCVSEHHISVLGVYRMVDSYNDRPVYKQDGGENYIYYSSASSSWLVGTVVGHSYGWLRNSSSARWVPDITSGWEYRPLTRSWDGNTQESWLSDDGTLRIEPLQAVDSIMSQIQDIKNWDNVE